MIRTSASLIVLALSLLIFGCKDERTAHLLESAPETDKYSELERLEKMQMVRVRTLEDGEIHDISVDEFEDDLRYKHCPSAFGCIFGTDNACDEYTCSMAGAACLARSYMAAAGVGTLLIEEPYSSDREGYEALPQSSATKAEFAERAFEAYSELLDLVQQFLLERPVSQEGGSCVVEDWDAIVREVGQHYVNAYHGARDAIDLAVQSNIAAADSQWGSTPDERISAMRVMSGPDLSRAKAAHLLVGGGDGLRGAIEAPLCTASPLSPPETRALEILRTAGISFRDVVDNAYEYQWLLGPLGSGTPIEDLLEGAAVGGNVHDRLEYFLQVEIDAPVTEHFGLSTEDFEQARRYLRQEFTAFARSWGTLPDPFGNAAPPYARYAGTSTKPFPRDPAYYVALLDQEAPFISAFFGLWGASYPDYRTVTEWERFGAENLADFLERAQAFAHFFLSLESTEDLADDVSGFENAVLDPLRLLVATPDVHGRIDVCTFLNGVEFIAHGFVPTDGLVIGRGEDVLHCATQGHVDGAPCVLDASSPNLVADLDTSVDPDMGYASAVFGWFEFGNFFEEAQHRFYLLQPKPGTNGGPGNYLALQGFNPYPEETDHCRMFPIVPDAIERAGAIVAPSPEWCTRSSVECAGESFDARLPLEDELSDDGDGIESSWRHYLNLARQAAAESDLLANEYLRAGLAVDLEGQAGDQRKLAQREKAAAELEQLQEICGTTVDISHILKWLGTQCVPSDECDFADSFDLSEISDVITYNPGIGGHTVAGWQGFVEEETELGDLKKCLASFEDTEELVALGDSDLCVFKDEEGNYCDPQWGIECPLHDEEAQSCPDPGETITITSLEGAEVELSGVHIGEGKKLNFFSTPSWMPPPPVENMCDGIRRLRDAPAEDSSDVLIQNLVRSSLFHHNSLDEFRETIQVEALYGGYVAINVGPQRQWATGDPATGPSDTWPCSTEGMPEICSETCTLCGPNGTMCCGDGLFCFHGDCQTRAGVGQVNRRLIDAVLATIIMTNREDAAPHRPVLLPHYLHVDLAKPRQAPSLLVDQVVATGGVAAELGASIPIFANAKWTAFNSVGDPPELGHAFSIADAFEGTGNEFNLESERILALGDARIIGVRDNADAVFFGGLRIGDEKDGYLIKMLQAGYAHETTLEELASDLETVVIGPTHDVPCNAWDLTHCASLSNDPGIRELQVSAEWADLELKPTYPFNTLPGRAFDGPELEFDYKHKRAALMDGLELMCAVKEGAGLMATERACGDPPTYASLEDLDDFGEYITCIGDFLTAKAALATFRDFPKAAMVDVETGATAFATEPGQINQAISRLRSSLYQVALAGPAIGRTVRNIGSAMGNLHSVMTFYDIEGEMRDVRYNAEEAQQMMQCAVAAARAGGAIGASAVSTATTNPGAGAQAVGEAIAAMATCNNSAAQIGFAQQLRDLGGEQDQVEREKAIREFEDRFYGTESELRTLNIQLSDNLEIIRRTLGEVETLKRNAQRRISQALWYMTDQAAEYPEINNVLDNSRALARERYERSHRNAVRMAFLAKRAIEMRLGLRLAQMADDLPLVQAPQLWESTLCATQPISYDDSEGTLFNPGQTSFTDEGVGAELADSFIGDYVRRLENVVESYRMEYNFHEGSDTLVASLRDDILGVRATCETESDNLLYHSGDLTRLRGYERLAAEGDVPAWFLEGCVEPPEEGEPEPLSPADCITVNVQRGMGLTPFAESAGNAYDSPGFRLVFGESSGWCGPNGSCDEDITDAGVFQRVRLSPGRYRYSWYTRATFATQPGGQAGHVRRVGDPQEVTPIVSHFIGTTEADPNWSRAHFVFDVADEEDYLVGFALPTKASGNAVQVGAPMLERIEQSVDLEEGVPRQYQNTTEVRTLTRQTCEDTDGFVFRQKYWTRGCVHLCPDGFSSDCRSRAEERCFYETSFHVSQAAIEAGDIFNQSGFARGNFNYRIDNVALNFVGTGIRDCSDSDVPQPCFSAGFVPYSLAHQGPFYVRNHRGEDFKALLFDGNIEHARGLATERYISNPIGSADAELLAPYTRTEFQGRPLDGDFVLRVWEEEGTAFNSIDDVQVVLNYRYWTRFD